MVWLIFTLATPTICGFAQHLAKTLVIRKRLVAGIQALTNGTTYWIKNRRIVDGVPTDMALRLENGALLLSPLAALLTLSLN
jgi:hypothetical protein